MERHEVAVVGAGPSGAACAYWLARAGWDVVLFERKQFPRAKTCGDGLTPRAVRQLWDMGLDGLLEPHHRFDGLRALAAGLVLELPWPKHPHLPTQGYVITRAELDIAVAETASKAGAALRQSTEATPLLDDDGQLTGVVAHDHNTGSSTAIEASYVVVADGSNSRFGRALGAQRARRLPLGMALRGYWRSPRSDEPWIESHLDLSDADGSTVPGYGWVFPLGDGLVNVGVGLLSTSSRWRGLNTSHLLETFLAKVEGPWQLEPAGKGLPTGGKLPMGLSVTPPVGRRHVLVGDAAGTINPFNGEGISYGYESGRLAAWAVGNALSSGDWGALSLYSDELERLYGEYYRLAARFVSLIERPTVLRKGLKLGMRSPAIMAVLLRLMGNVMRTGRMGAAELTFAAASSFSRAAERRAELEKLEAEPEVDLESY